MVWTDVEERRRMSARPIDLPPAKESAPAQASDVVCAAIRDLGEAMRRVASAQGMGLRTAIAQGRALLNRVEHAEAARGEASSAALLDACALLLESLDELAGSVEMAAADAARRERMRIAQMLTQLEQAAEMDDGYVEEGEDGLAQGDVARPAWHAEQPPAQPLTQQERTVLELLAMGAGTQQIAEALTISPTTAKKHVCNVLEKLGVSDRLSAVLRGQSLGLVPPASRPLSRVPRRRAKVGR